MREFIKRWVAVNLSILMILGVLFIAGCEDEKKPIYHWKVFQEKADGTYIMWTMPDKPSFDEGFVYWTREDGNKVYVGGNVTVETFKAGEK